MKTDQIQEVLQKYTYNPSAGKQIAMGITSYKGIKQDNLTPVTIKIIDSTSNELYSYFMKLKSVQSDYVSKIYELVKNELKVVVVFQDSTYGTLAMAISKCKRLEDSDFIHISKIILNAQIELLRSGINWIGDENDIQITENGMKLSWNGASLSPRYKNPLPEILNKLSFRENSIGLLPFPNNKQIQEIIQLASENATVISSHDIIKKRTDKQFKKKGKGWLAIRQSKNKNQYYQEVVYLAVSAIYGFLRVKCCESGNIQKGTLQLNKQKFSFTKLIDNYEDQGNIVFVSEYSNDGNLLQYITKLKTAGVILNEDQIEFFFYSLIEPIKQIQNSSLLSLNTLHIRNIFIQFGTIKIGEPIPMSNRLVKTLQQRAQVPDFYHPKFKSNPSMHNPSFDTYSLGILLYKLMYTEYPIFPEGKVHIPTAPSYKSSTVSTLELFLNEGGKIADIESRILVSEKVKKQIRQYRKKKLEENSRKNMIKTQRMGGESSFFKHQSLGIYRTTDNHITMNQIQPSELRDESIIHQNESNTNIWNYLFQPVVQDKSQKVLSSFFIDTEYSNYRNYRICINLIIMVCIYILVFYMFYLKNLFNLFISSTAYHSLTVQVNSVKYVINVIDDNKFYQKFKSTVQSDLQGANQSLNCAVNSDGNNFTTYVNDQSAGWMIYLVFSLLFFSILFIYLVSFIILKISQGTTYDLVNAVSKYQLKRRSFNISRYIILNITFGLALYCHYFMFNFVFHGQYEPCFGGNQSEWYSSTYRLFYNRSSLTSIIVPTMLGILLYYLVIIQFLVSKNIKRYNRIFNPITLFVPAYIALTIIMRLGVLKDFNPSWLNNSIIKQQFSNKNYIAIFGIIPEILILGQNLISLLIDYIFWKIFDSKKRITAINDQSSVQVRSHDMNKSIV